MYNGDKLNNDILIITMYDLYNYLYINHKSI